MTPDGGREMPVPTLLHADVRKVGVNLQPLHFKLTAVRRSFHEAVVVTLAV